VNHPAPDLPVLLGFECGGTRTVAIAASPNLTQLGRVEGGPANLRLISDTDLADRFRQLATTLPSPSAIGVGMAGVRDPADIQRVLAILDHVWPGIPARVDHDLESALSAASLETSADPRSKVIVLSGTGSCCYGRSPSGRTAKVGGWGHLLGDRGSAYDIAHRALRASAHHLDHTGRWSSFGSRALRATLLNTPNDLIAWLQSASKTDVAALAPEVFEAALHRDPVARRILDETVEILAADAIACALRLGKPLKGVDFVLAGSVLLKQPRFARQVAQRIRNSLPEARVIPLQRDSAWGAVIMARQALATRPHPDPRPAQPTSPPIPGNTSDKTPNPIPPTSHLSPTEERNPASTQLDRLPLARAIDCMLDQDARITEVIRKHRKSISLLVERVAAALSNGGHLIYVGAGTSGRLGVLDASECPPTFRTPPEWVQGIMAGGMKALYSAVEGAEDSPTMGRDAVVHRNVGPRDIVMGIAASGRTPFVWGALHEARERGAFTALLCFNPHLRIPRGSPPDLLLDIDTGPEILTGSTRLKAGTATKLVLNIVTTLAMVRLGKVVGNLMVDLNPSNLKLRDRAVRIVRELTGADPQSAADALEAEGWIVTSAIARLGRQPALPHRSGKR
jgi:N-acetylmuramic acid 6-phosphate etherase